MSDLVPLPPDSARLRVLEIWLAGELDRIRAAREAAEQREAEEAAQPGWWVQWARRAPNQPPRGVLHQRGCWCPGQPSLYAKDVRQLLAAHGDRIEMCSACRPRERRLRRVVRYLCVQV